MRKLLIILAAVCGLSASPVLAQEASGPSDRARELARQYVEMMDVSQMIEDQFLGSLALAGGWLDDREADTPVPAPDDPLAAMAPMIELMESLIVEAHAQVFTEAELEALVAFYGGETGRSILDKQSELSLAMSTLMIERLPEMLEAMGDLRPSGEVELSIPRPETWSQPAPPTDRQMTPGG